MRKLSSIYRDIGEEMESIYKEIKKIDLKNASKEELMSLLEGIKDSAKDSYASYASALGWHENYHEAISSLEEEQEEIEESEGYDSYRFELSEWITKQKNLSSSSIEGLVENESLKAYLVFILKPDNNVSHEPIWIPKSHVIKKEKN